MTLEEKLKHFQTTTMENATKKSEEMLKEYKDALNKVFEEHKLAKNREAELQIKIEKDDIKREQNKELSNEQIRIKKSLRDKHEKLKEELFAKVYQKISNFMQTEEYTQVLIKQIKKALDFAKEEPLTIYIDAVDASKKEELEQATGTTLEVSEESFLGGIRAIVSSKHVLIDESFETKFEEIKARYKLDGGCHHE